MEHLNDGGNYNKVLDYAINNYSKKDPKEMAKLSNSIYIEGEAAFKLKWMDKNLYVKYPSGEVFNEEGNPINKTALEILVIRFLTNANPIPPTNEYITFKEVDGGYVYYPAFYKTSMKRLKDMFGNNIEKFNEVMEAIGAEKVKMGDSAYKMRFLNHTYVIYVVWEGDEEFEATANILFDKNIGFCFNAEDIAVVGDMPFIRISEELNKEKI